MKLDDIHSHIDENDDSNLMGTVVWMEDLAIALLGGYEEVAMLNYRRSGVFKIK